MMQPNKLLAILLSLTLCGTFALKGNRSRSQQVKNDSRRGLKGVIHMHGRKCNNHLPKKGNDHIDHDGVVDCPPVILKPDCDALRSGSIPSSDGTASAKMSLEVTATSDNAIEQLNQALNEAALMVMSCPTPRPNRELDEEVVLNKPPKGPHHEGPHHGPHNGPHHGPHNGPHHGPHNEATRVSLNGYAVGNLSKPRRSVCTMNKQNCIVYQTPFTMYYSGNADAADLNSFAKSLADAVTRKLNEEKYRRVATVHDVYIDDSSFTMSSSLVRKMPAGAIITGAVGCLALLGGVVGLMYYKKRVASSKTVPQTIETIEEREVCEVPEKADSDKTESDNENSEEKENKKNNEDKV